VSDADWALSILGVDGRAARSGEGGLPPFDRTLTANRLTVDPALPEGLQLLVGSSLNPVVATRAGLLIGEKIQRGRRIWIVADPDLLSNHGLFVGDGAAFAGALIEALRGPAGAVVFDESVHGFAAPAANPLRALLEFPFVVASLYALATLAVVLWSAMGRFGAAEPAPVARVAGKMGLIRNVAELIAFAGGREDVAMNYLRYSVDDAARRLRAPAGLGLERQMEWLDGVGRARGRAGGVADIARRLVGQRQDGALARAALDLHDWKQEILRGP